MSIYMWKLVTVSHQLAMFSGHWSSKSGQVKYLIYHVTSKNNVIEESTNFMSENSSWYANTFPSLVAKIIVVVEICFQFVTWSNKTKKLKGQFTEAIGAPQGDSSPCQNWWSEALQQLRYNGFSLSHDLARQLYQDKPPSHKFCWQ